MILLLSGSRDIDLPFLKGYLAQHGIAVSTSKSESHVPSSPSVRQCFLISTEQGVVSLGERITPLREALGLETPLTVCAPKPSAADREVLRECGASSLITPTGWSPRQVAERIAAEMIAGGHPPPTSFGTILGATPAMRDLYERIERIAPLHVPILVLGETGSGKERVAHEIHERSGRKGRLFPINCAALTPELLESELFGHERGAFTGALEARKGLLVEAGQGTVFLDEIGDLSPSSQAKLLRVLEEGTVRPVGSNRWQPIQARVILATHRDLDQASSNGNFRNDLFQRIRGFSLQLAPLRERKPDLLLLAQHFLNLFNREYPGARFAPPGTFDTLFRYDWPGNVRELRQAIWQSAAYAEGDRGPISALSLTDWTRRRREIPSKAKRSSPFDPAVDTWKEAHDRLRASYFHAVLDEAGGNKDLAAKRAGLSRSQFYEVLKQIGRDPSIEPEENSSEGAEGG
jgi:two-component system, NtrC family, response regulator HydG